MSALTAPTDPSGIAWGAPHIGTRPYHGTWILHVYLQKVYQGAYGTAMQRHTQPAPARSASTAYAFAFLLAFLPPPGSGALL